METLLKYWREIAITLAVLFSLLGVTLEITDEDGDGRPDKVVITPGERQLPVGAAGELAGTVDTHEGEDAAPLSSQDVPGETKAEERETIKENVEVVEDQAVEYDTSRVLEGAAGKPAHFACYTSMNGGARPISAIGLNVVHVTVSLNVAGLGDVNGLCAFFRRVKASPTWTVDNEGNSAENVPLGRVPWTQVIFNRAACSTEFVGSTGRPGQGPAQWTDIQLREGARLAAKCHAVAGIPVRKAIVRQDGSIVRTGVITHEELGLAGGGHSDPGPYFNMARYMSYIRHFLNPCGSGCKALKKRHRAAHARYKRRGCRSTPHKAKQKNLRRPECKRVKHRIHVQHRKLDGR